MSKFEEIIGYKFKDDSLLKEALTHPSITKFNSQNNSDIFNYERLEFLGDSVLGLIIAEILIDKYPNEQEGQLAKRQSALVKGETVSKVAKELNIGKYINMTQGEESTGGRSNLSNIENALEALIGALYVDGGITEAKIFIKKHWKDIIDQMKVPPKEHKTSLQEWAQGNGLPIPEYNVVEISGPSHSPSFIVEVYVQGFDPVRAKGKNKKKAEKEAAKELLKIIHKE
ncbi:ribonuclease III [Rickettsiales bacterium]|nr:ribonuclease III [Rickettsiales bacterium]